MFLAFLEIQNNVANSLQLVLEDFHFLAAIRAIGPRLEPDNVYVVADNTQRVTDFMYQFIDIALLTLTSCQFRQRFVPRVRVALEEYSSDVFQVA